MTEPIQNDRLELRLTPEARQTLQAAAEIAQRSIDDFVLESALERAKQMLASEAWFGLDTDRYQEFLGALDASPRRLPRIERLFRESSVFEQDSSS